MNDRNDRRRGIPHYGNADPRFASQPPRPRPKRDEQRKSGPTGPTEKLHKVLARAGLGSRLAMEQLIAGGHLTVNGKSASIGLRVGPQDTVRLDGKVLKLKFADETPRILLYHKPEGEIVSHDDPQARPTVFDKLPKLKGAKWTVVGRLDLNSCGLMVFSTSGDLANRLAHPRFEIEREYAVRVMGELTPEQKEQLLQGVELEDGPAKFASIEERGGEGANRWYNVVLSEGRNREVRRMFETLGLMVSRLMRVRYGMISLPPRLKRGQWLEMEPKQVAQVLNWLGFKPAAAEQSAPKESAGRQQRRRHQPNSDPRASAERQNPHRPTYRAK
jgi:23S rRNA pseudouridine2605 synthase